MLKHYLLDFLCVQVYHLQVLPFHFLLWSTNFPCPTVRVKEHFLMLTRNGDSGHCFLLPSLKISSISFLLLKYLTRICQFYYIMFYKKYLFFVAMHHIFIFCLIIYWTTQKRNLKLTQIKESIMSNVQYSICECQLILVFLSFSFY